MAKIPYFRFFVDDWLSSQKVQVEMDDSERGIYIQLLAIAWNCPDCTLPLDVEKCRIMVRAKRAAKVKKVLELCFTKTENGWRNDRELIENQHANEFISRQVLAGKASANKRKQSTAVQPALQRWLNQPEPEPEEPIRGVNFTPPSLQEIKAYCSERRNGINPEKFLNYYESKGWMIGKNKMKNWKAAVRTWETTGYNKQETTMSDDRGMA